MADQKTGRRGVFAWCLYDWANSPFTTVVITFVFSAYFAKAVAPDEVTGTSLWGYAMSLSGLAIALTAPLFGSIADKTGRRKPWLLLFTLLCAATTVFLWQIRPEAAYVTLALMLAAVANYGFESAMVFYNAMLPDIAPRHKIGRVSGWGWGLGYFGGLAALAVCLVGFVQAETPWFGLSKEGAEHLRATPVMVALWLVVFSVPLFLFTPDRKRTDVPLGRAAREGVATLIDTLKKVRDYRNVFWFLIARMLYTDGLNTLFAFGGIYAAGTFGFSFTDLILFGIAINVTSGVGAFAFGWIDDRLGPKKTIIIALIGLIFLSIALLLIESKTLFWVFGLPLGIFVGPAQSASRSYMARLAPPELTTEMFGLYAFSGKATAFLGPAVLALATDMFTSQKAGMATILGFFVIGGLLLLKVPEPLKIEK